MTRALLIALDDAIASHADTGTDSITVESRRKQIIETISQLHGETDSTEGEVEAVRRIESDTNDPSLAACMARLVACGNRWLNENPWRSALVQLFDSCFKEVYAARKIGDSLQSHQKVEAIALIVAEVQTRFDNALSLLTSLDHLNGQQQALFKVLNGSDGKAFLLPFLPNNALPLLLESFTRSKEYVEKRTSPEIVEVHDRTVKALAEIRSSFSGTTFSSKIAATLDHLLELVNRDFARNPAVQSAKIEVGTHDNKKYPLNTIDQEIRIRFLLKNVGSGFADDTAIEIIASDSLQLISDSLDIGRISPNETRPIEFLATVAKTATAADISLEVQWRNFDGTDSREEREIQLVAQNTNVDWSNVKMGDPYSLEPVISENELVGRRDQLDRIVPILTGSNMGSVYMKGQKRVGKTSLGKVIQERLQSNGFLVIYLESGEYLGGEDPKSTVRQLGDRLVQEIKRADPRLRNLPSPNFVDALSPITGFLDDAKELLGDRRIVFILDEFDELPVDLYSNNNLGDSFFQTLRSISGRIDVGFLVIGSEKMDRIIEHQGSKINKWQMAQVDYFSRESDWQDYVELVRQPTKEILEFTENAILTLHSLTAGNPYFTKLICRRIYEQALKDHDSHITRTEVNRAGDLTAAHEDKNRFQHFWDDGIIDPSAHGQKSFTRRKVLISLVDVLRKKLPTTALNLAHETISKDVTSLDTELNDFVSRRVLIRTNDSEPYEYDFKVKLFRKWMECHGVEEIITTFSEQTVAVRQRQAEEKKRVPFENLQELAERWGSYKSTKITFERIRSWLDQFSKSEEQQIAYRILQNLKFYSDDFIRDKMHDVDAFVRRGGDIVHHVEGKKKRSDILISYLDGPGKSGAHLARFYADKARLRRECIIERGRLLEELRERREIQALVFLDDFVGTGDSGAKELESLVNDLDAVFLGRQIKVVYSSIVAFEDGWKRISELAERAPFTISTFVCEELTSRDRCFSPDSDIFKDEQERDLAREMAYRYGLKAGKNVPLGYGELGLPVIFERSCPNNSLAILWSSSNSWIPLFPRN